MSQIANTLYQTWARENKRKHWGMAGIGAVSVLTPNVANTVAQTIQKVEGYYAGSLAYKNNNPGNLRYAGQYGSTGKDSNGFAVFPSYDAGYQALLNQINLDASRGMTISAMMAKYAPAGDGGNNPIAYANTIADALGVSPDTVLASISGSDPASQFLSSTYDISGTYDPATNDPIDSTSSTIDISTIAWASAAAIGLLFLINRD